MGMESVRHEQLLEHRAFVQRLARELVRDAAAADDLAQEAWVRALERPPRMGAARAWFRTVLANLAARERRGRAGGKRASGTWRGRREVDRAAPTR
jgi:DNA-directed RNA polymerase specialized sigma24 family protein